ncbi:MAG: glycosyltransferase family 4 protein [Candidatus Sumerlaeota bacterium]
MKVAMISPIAWRTPPRDYGPWELIASRITEGLAARGVDVTLFATADSVTNAKLRSVVKRGYEEDPTVDPKVCEYLHIAQVFEQGDEFDIIHNNFDFMPLAFSSMTRTPLVTTIHGFSSEKILPVYEKYNDSTYYVAISESDKSSRLDYIATVYHGLDMELFTFKPDPGDYLLFFGRVHPDKGAKEAIEIAKKVDMPLVMAGVIQDDDYYKKYVEPHIDGEKIQYVGSAGPELRDELLGGAYALLHPINFDEPFGLSVAESMACGTPVLAVKRGSMPEVINDGVSGYLVKNAAEMAEAVSRVPDLDRRACREWVEDKFSEERMIDDYIKVYEAILDRHRT